MWYLPMNTSVGLIEVAMIIFFFNMAVSFVKILKQEENLSICKTYAIISFICIVIFLSQINNTFVASFEILGALINDRPFLCDLTNRVHTITVYFSKTMPGVIGIFYCFLIHFVF